MKITEIRYGAEATIATRQFENLRPSYRVKATVEEGENLEEAREELEELVGGWLIASVDSIRASLAG